MTARTSGGARGVRRMRLAALGAILVLGVSACGSSEGSEAPGSSGGNAESAAAAKAAVEKLMVRPTTLEVPALPSKPTPGQTIDYIACGVPACQQYIPFLEEATAAIGWKVKVINSGVTPQSVAAAYDQAVRDKPAGVIGSGGVSPDLFAKQLAQLKTLDVPVALQVVPESDLPGITAIVYGEKDTAQNGTDLGNLLLADSGAKDVHLGIVGTPATPVYTSAHGPISDALKSDSCSSCSVEKFEFPIADLGPNLPSKVISFLRSHPDINYLFFDFTNETDGMPAALKRAGLADKVKIVTSDITSTQAGYMKAGQNLIGVAGNPWPEILWAEVGIIATHSVGGDVDAAKSIELPHMLITKANLIDSKGATYFPLVENYQDIFKKAWQVG